MTRTPLDVFQSSLIVGGGSGEQALSPLEMRLLNDYQKEFPMEPEPFAVMAAELGVTGQEVIDCLESLMARGMVVRVGPVFRVRRVGVSTLAAMAVPRDRLEDVAALVSGFDEVNHNYEREHRFNLWFVVTGPDRRSIDSVLEAIAERTGLPVMDLPMEEDYHIDLGFPLWC